jgi:hypothetical protein
MTQFPIPTKTARAALAATVLTGALMLAGAAQAADKAGEKQRAVVLQQVLDCRTVADQTARLACYDAAVGKMDQAEKSGDIVVVDRDQVREAKKAAFGFEMPHFTLFDRGEKPEKIDQVAGVAAEAYVNKDGKWVIVLEDGAKWVQVDGEAVYNAPHKGSKVDIRTAAMGSFFMKVDGQRAIRAHRVN